VAGVTVALKTSSCPLVVAASVVAVAPRETSRSVHRLESAHSEESVGVNLADRKSVFAGPNGPPGTYPEARTWLCSWPGGP
jgi:hypothetical protein